MNTFVPVLRLAAVLSGCVAVIATMADTATRAKINPFNFFGFFLAGQEGGVALAWANSVVHVVLPLYAVLDRILFNDRCPLAWKRLWVSLIYPVVWVVVVLIRGATDGWVPYPFFDPGTGYGLVSAYVVGIAVLTAATAAVVWALSRVHLVGGDHSAAVTT